LLSQHPEIEEQLLREIHNATDGVEMRGQTEIYFAPILFPPITPCSRRIVEAFLFLISKDCDHWEILRFPVLFSLLASSSCSFAIISSIVMGSGISGL
jgi:hypothetical protein